MPDEVDIPLEPDLLQDVLEPYYAHCKYVTAGVVRRRDDRVTLNAELTIGPSCYLVEAEPFQPAEFNICYNQLLYLVLAQGVVSGLYPELADWGYADFKRHQLPDVLILAFECRFDGPPIERRAFRGSITVDRVEVKRTLTLLETRCCFTDERGGKAEGEVTIGIVTARHGSPERA